MWSFDLVLSLHHWYSLSSWSSNLDVYMYCILSYLSFLSVRLLHSSLTWRHHIHVKSRDSKTNTNTITSLGDMADSSTSPVCAHALELTDQERFTRSQACFIAPRRFVTYNPIPKLTNLLQGIKFIDYTQSRYRFQSSTLLYLHLRIFRP